jgi:hypothetical protein
MTPPSIGWSALQNIGILGIPLLMFFVAWRYSLADLKLLWQRIPVLNLSFVRSSSKEVKEV